MTYLNFTQYFYTTLSRYLHNKASDPQGLLSFKRKLDFVDGDTNIEIEEDEGTS